MKAFTDISQGKILKEILPIDTADIWYAEVYEGKTIGYDYIISDTPYYSLSFTRPSENNYSQNTVKDIPCWTLSALLDVLPTLDERNANFCKDIRNNKWHVFYLGTATLPIIDTERHDNLIDAVFEMIVKLKEENLL